MGERTNKMREVLKAVAKTGVPPGAPPVKAAAPKPKKNQRDREMAKFRLPIGTSMRATYQTEGQWTLALVIPNGDKDPIILQGDGSGIHALMIRLGLAWQKSQQPSEEKPS